MEKNLKDQKFSNVKKNECINSEIFLFDLNIEELESRNIFNGKQGNFLEENKKNFSKLLFFVDNVLNILENTESFCRLNIFFEKLSKKITVGFLENILNYVYSIVSINAKFLDCKKFVINFPQIISKDFIEIYESDIKTFDEFDYEKNKMEFFGNL